VEHPPVASKRDRIAERDLCAVSGFSSPSSSYSSPSYSNVLPEFSCEKKPWNFAPRPGIACKYCDARCFACKYPLSLSKKRQVLAELQWDESFMLQQTAIILGRINVLVSILFVSYCFLENSFPLGSNDLLILPLRTLLAMWRLVTSAQVIPSSCRNNFQMNFLRFPEAKPSM